MEVDTCCLFANLGTCEGLENSCCSLCKLPSTTDDSSLLLGATSKMEYLLLKYGKFDMLPCNVEEYHVCDNHSRLLPTSKCKNCSLCKLLGRSKSSVSGLRTITKQYAFTAWKMSDVHLSFGRRMCAQCRIELGKYFSKEDLAEEYGALFQWLYNVNTTHTPSTDSSYSHHVLSQSFQGLTMEEEYKNLRQFLRDMNYFEKVPTTKSFEKLHPSSKKRFCRQSNKVLKRVLRIMASNDDVDLVWQSCTESSRKSHCNIALDNNLRIVMNSLAEAYGNASHWTIRRQILSIMAKDLPFSMIIIFIPGLTLYRFYAARCHASFEGRGTVVDDSRTPTIRYDDYQLEHFIEFIVSPHICTDLPFGEKELRLSTGETLLIPLTIRNLAPQRIITQYYAYCKEYYQHTFQPLGQSTLFSVLNECVASTRKSLQGLDSFSADGSTAFDSLASIVDSLLSLGLTTTEASEMKRDLQNSRNYLKTDYKVHISCESSVPDHCSTFALNDPADKCWQSKCQHEHVQQCDRCELLKRVLIKVRAAIEQHQTDILIRDRLLFRVRQQIKCIEEWKAHQLRTVHQDQARTDVLENLDKETVMVHVDWAMKWLPVKYRESTKDHFAKRGMSWHIAYVIRKKPKMSQDSSNSLSGDETETDTDTENHFHDHVYQHKVFCHVFDQCIQNAKTVISILRHVFLRLRETTPEIKYVHLRSDNAGCYHGAEALLSVEQLFKETGVWIKTIDFSDPQGGKGPCDRLAAVIKCSIRRFIDEKNDCTNSIEFLAASERTKGVEFHACEILNSQIEKVEWKGVKLFNNIEYQRRDVARNKKSLIEIRVWKSYNVGVGKVYRWSDLHSTVKTISPLKTILSTTIPVSWTSDLREETEDAPESDESDSSDEDDDREESVSHGERQSDDQTFDCPVDGCIKRYVSYGNLLRHTVSGKHLMKLEKCSLIDKSKILFHQNLTRNHTRTTPLLSITVIPPSHPSPSSMLSEGWASHKMKGNSRFNDKQKQFLQDKFNDGVQSGMKWDPVRVAQDMEMLIINGDYVFENEECLTQAQIKSYFSRLTLKQRSKQLISTQEKATSSSSASVTTSVVPEMDDSDDDYEEPDDRDLDVYMWRQMVDTARHVLDTPSNSYDTSIERSYTVPSSSESSSTSRAKRKSTDEHGLGSKQKTN